MAMSDPISKSVERRWARYDAEPTRNSLVVLPLAFAVPDGLPLVPAIVVTQTLIELLSELGYVRFIARLGRRRKVWPGS